MLLLKGVSALPPSPWTIEVLAGGERGYADGADGAAALQARFDDPRDVALAPDGALYVVDSGNHRVRRIDPETGLIETVIGPGALASSGAGASASALPILRPGVLAVAPFGNLLVADARQLRIVAAGRDGAAKGDDEVRVLYESSSDDAVCISGIHVAAADRVRIVDECGRRLLELQRRTLEP